MAGTLKNIQCHPFKIGGVNDPVHICLLVVKEYCSRRYDRSGQRLLFEAAEGKGHLRFCMANSCGAFSVSESNVEAVVGYISDQIEHHRKFFYQEEVRQLLKRHRIAFDERYLWE